MYVGEAITRMVALGIALASSVSERGAPATGLGIALRPSHHARRAVRRSPSPTLHTLSFSEVANVAEYGLIHASAGIRP
jgi:hypothetical protein